MTEMKLTIYDLDWIARRDGPDWLADRSWQLLIAAAREGLAAREGGGWLTEVPVKVEDVHATCDQLGLGTRHPPPSTVEGDGKEVMPNDHGKSGTNVAQPPREHTYRTKEGIEYRVLDEPVAAPLPSNDIAERLKSLHVKLFGNDLAFDDPDATLGQAATALTEAQEELERLREALERIANPKERGCTYDAAIARAALGQPKGTE